MLDELLSSHGIAPLFLLIAAVIISYIDFRLGKIPDWLTLPGIVIGLLLTVLPESRELTDSLAGVVLGFSILYVLAFAGELVLKKPVMGGGDIKLAAMLGAFLGWNLLLLSFVLASFGALGFALGRRTLCSVPFNVPITFGPFLAWAAFVSYLFGEALIQLWLGLISLY